MIGTDGIIEVWRSLEKGTFSKNASFKSQKLKMHRSKVMVTVTAPMAPLRIYVDGRFSVRSRS